MNSKMMLCSGLGTKILGDGRRASCKICLLTAGKCPEVSFKISNGVLVIPLLTYQNMVVTFQHILWKS